MYTQANTLSRKFNMCTDGVKLSLFRAYCTPLYTAHLWSDYRRSSMRRLQVAYNDAMRILLRRPRWSSASEMFVTAGVNTLQALLRNLMYKFICRLNVSQNVIIKLLVNPCCSDVRYQSPLWRHWYMSLL